MRHLLAVTLTALSLASAATAAITERTSGPSAKWSNPVNRALLRLARCETGYLKGGRVNWRHHNSVYTGGLGFAHSTYRYYKQFVRPVPKAEYARDASVAEQLAVGRVLVRTFGGYSSWPSCSRRLGLAG